MKVRNRFLISLAARIVAGLSRILFWTCKIVVIEKVPGVSPYEPVEDQRYLYCNWHDGILGAIFCGYAKSMAALTSRHSDGDYVADIMRIVGIHPVRGSSSRGGATAVKKMLEMASEYRITIATDGPRGPRRVVKSGILFLASHSNRKIVPVAFSAKRAWRPWAKWTDLVIPKPFTTVYAIGGEPMSVPQGLARNELEHFRGQLQQRMDELTQEAESLAGHSCQSDSHQLKQRAA